MTDPVSRAALRWPWLVPLQGHSSILIQVQVLRDGRPGKQWCQRVVRDHDARVGCPHMLKQVQQGWRHPVLLLSQSMCVLSFRFCVKSQICWSCVFSNVLREALTVQVFPESRIVPLLRWNSPTDLFRLPQLWLPNTHKQCLFSLV